MKNLIQAVLGVMLALTLIGCQDGELSLPNPLAVTNESIGNYCGMVLTEHAGPKAQVFEKHHSSPLWFSSVKDAIVYLTLPGEAQDAVVTYVHDMAKAESWENPQNDGIWIDVRDAYFVIGSQKLGGMGMPEFAPFSLAEKAAEFAKEHGGKVVRLSQITNADLALVDPAPEMHSHN